MTNMLHYWARVKQIRTQLATIDEPIFLISKPGAVFGLPPGIVSQSDRETAARRMADGSHELATDEQISQYRATQAENAKTIEATGRFFQRLNGGIADRIQDGE